MSSVMNRIQNDAQYALTYPKMVGKNDSLATQELHIFLAEINPQPEMVQKYYQVVKEWNDLHPEMSDKMKACFLALIFRDVDGNDKTISVMQSARYFRCDDTEEVVRQAHADADWFVEKGFSVIREKIEATAYAIDGIPQTDEEAASYPAKYFEFHIKVGKKDAEDGAPLTAEEIQNLKTISRVFTSKFGIPVPLSYNCNKDKIQNDGQGSQRFLNLRFRDEGIKTIAPKVREVSSAIENAGLKVLKTISEYVWYDSFPQLDQGWIDYSSEELHTLVRNLA